jgi:hypothetical protein
VKPIIILALCTFLCFGCDKGSININNPDVAEFVRQLENGTYDQYEWTEEGERLWAIMPDFQKEDIPALINLAEKTLLVTPCDHFPVNPLSSMWPYRVVDGKECILLGEYLLWCAEAVIEGKDFASLNPVLHNINHSPEQRLDAAGIMAVRKLYQEWWDEYGRQPVPAKLPLEGTGYVWR